MVDISERVAILEKLLITHEEGVPLIDAHRKTGMSYKAIRRHSERLGYRIVKSPVIRSKKIFVIKR